MLSLLAKNLTRNPPRADRSEQLGTAPRPRCLAPLRAVCAAVLSCGLLSGVAPALADEQPVRVDGLLAVIGGTAPGPGVDAILLSDVELRAWIVLSGRSSEPVALDPIPTKLIEATLNELIGEQLIAREARRVQAARTSAQDVERERTQLVRSAGGEERMHALLLLLSADPEELDVIARRRALVGAFLSANLEGVTVVTESEVARAYDAEKQSFAGRDPGSVRAELRTRLSREALDRTIERWVTVLRSRTKLRVYVQ
jgi:hypothetical protein